MEEIMSYEERYRKYKQELDGAFTQAAEKFVLIGYLLREAAETDILRSSGYKNMEEFAYAEYGVDPSQANRFININRRFSEGGNSKQLKQQYRGIGSSKLAVMLTIPDEINEVLPKNLTKEELKEIQAEVKAENQVSDIEVEIEKAEAAAVTDKPMLPPEGSPLERNLWQLGKEQEELFRKLWMVCFMETASGNRNNAEIMDVLIPQGDAVYTVRIPGERRTQIIVNSEGAAVVNLKTLERNKYTEDQICLAVRSLIDGGSSPEEQYKMLYGEDLTPEEPEVAPVQQDEPKKEKKPEKRKESRVTKANTEKKKPKEPERKPEQMTIPGAAPDPAQNEPETQANDSSYRETDADNQNTDTMESEEQVPGQTDLENDFPQYCPDADQRTAYLQSIRGAVDNLVRYAEMDLISAARVQVKDISEYLDKLEELIKEADSNAEAVEAGESTGV
ncbi:MAG: hypothetical protein ACLUP9_04425 [Waltera sp.]|jgi:hypothetical protein|uniref:hypothetical protein n=1 Tax=Waltera sp. TaxID=2815806 RepID=UPI002056FBF6|nr:hypothetical protein [Clostridium sp.]DAF15558.1 MAG TPA: Protein of unknown function (DUF3102) [Caudoviricetes sp.]DAT01432.1 MAG TPA: Protein of unknown function (DUF3102) [Bacteriophage sp.]